MEKIFSALILIFIVQFSSSQTTTTLGAGSASAGEKNTYIGSNSGSPYFGNQPSIGNTFLGYYSGGLSLNLNGVTRDYNTFLGYISGFKSDLKTSNISIGYKAAYYAKNLAGIDNSIFLGSSSGENAQVGGYNMFFGTECGSLVRAGSDNILVGTSVGKWSDLGNSNILIGSNSGTMYLAYPSSLGNSNILIGDRAGAEMRGKDWEMDVHYSVAEDCIVIGKESGAEARGSSNIFLGTGSGKSNNGNNNVFIGQLTGQGGNYNNKLIIDNSIGASKPLLEGDFGLKLFTVNGKMGINKVNPAYDLDVAGTIRATEIKVEAQTADFVFEDNYNLRDLQEVESFIKTNKHLPDIPSAAAMEESGVNLAEMNKLLLQKIEELTLYIIELQKQVRDNNSRIEGLVNK